MVTIQRISSLANKNISISNNGGNLSSDSGLILLKDFLHGIHWKDLVEETLHFHDKRSSFDHSYPEIFEQWVCQLIAGYPADSHANVLRKDPMFQLLLDKEKLASQPSYSRFLKTIQPQNITEISKLTTKLNDLYYRQTKPQEMVVDLDSTHSDTFGKQEDANFNAHYGTSGFHPLVAFDGLTGMFLGAKLRPGNLYTSNGAEDFLEPILEQAQSLPDMKRVLVRADSGFAKPAIYDLCQEKEVHFLIRLKSNAILKDKANALVSCGEETDYTKREVHWNEISYQANSWKQAFRVIIKSTREAGECLFRHEFLVTNMEGFGKQAAYSLYQKRGEMENFIKEIKNGFHFDKTDSHDFLTNEFRMMLSCVAYSIVQVMKRLVFPPKSKGKLISTIRFQLFHIAGKVTLHARKTCIQLSSTYVYEELFWRIARNIKNLRIA